MRPLSLEEVQARPATVRLILLLGLALLAALGFVWRELELVRQELSDFHVKQAESNGELRQRVLALEGKPSPTHEAPAVRQDSELPARPADSPSAKK